MTEQQERQNELLTRLELVEMMVKEGRQTTEYWGWSFVVWGAVYLVATGWSYWVRMRAVPWVVVVLVALVITSAIVQSKKKKGQLRTTISRSIGAIWTSVGIALMIFCFAVPLSGHGEVHSYVAAIECFLGVTNCASSIVLRWRGQFLVALLWWVSAVATCFAPEKAIAPIFIVATLIGMIGFGFYLIYLEHRNRPVTVQHG